MRKYNIEVTAFGTGRQVEITKNGQAGQVRPPVRAYPGTIGIINCSSSNSKVVFNKLHGI